MSAFAHHLGYEFKGGLRDKSQLFMNYLFPLLFLILVGSFMTKLNPAFRNGMIPAMSVFALMCSYLLSMPSGLVAARDAGILRSCRINGVPAWASLAAPALSTLGHMALVALAVIAAAALALIAALSFVLAYLRFEWDGKKAARRLRRGAAASIGGGVERAQLADGGDRDIGNGFERAAARG